MKLSARFCSRGNALSCQPANGGYPHRFGKCGDVKRLPAGVTCARQSGGLVRFSQDIGGGVLDNRPMGVTVNGQVSVGVLALSAAGFDEGARLYGPTGSLLYVAKSRNSTAQKQVFALWQKAFGSDALELITGVDCMVLKYSVGRSDYGGQIGYFDAYALPVDAEVVLVAA